MEIGAFLGSEQRHVLPGRETRHPHGRADGVIALAGSFGGAAVATVLPASVFKPVIVVAR